MHPTRTPSYARVECTCGTILHMTRAHIDRAGLPVCGCGKRTRIATTQHRQTTKPRRVQRKITRPIPLSPVKVKTAARAKPKMTRNMALLLKAKFASHISGDPETLYRNEMGHVGHQVDLTLTHNGNTIHVNDTLGQKVACDYLKAQVAA